LKAQGINASTDVVVVDAPHILIVAGETSGDLHAASVIKSLRRKYTDITITGVAGLAMQAEGCHVLHPMTSLNVMGIGDVVKALPRIRRIGRDICMWAASEKPDLVILVDFPGFNMRLGEKLRKLGIPVLYYIAPKLWAWGDWRVKRLRRAQDKLACILPFEPEWFAKRGIDASYVGNPSALACKNGWHTNELKAKLGIHESIPLLALLPGSRRSELALHAGLLAEVYTKLCESIPNLVAVTTRAPGVSDEQLQPLLAVGAHVLDRLDVGYAMRTDAAIAVSGTATLELALWDTPTVLVYKAAPLTIWLGRKLVAMQCAGLANILLDDKPVMPELIQEQASVENIIHAILPLLQNQSVANEQRRQFEDLRQRLGNLHPSDAVANIVWEMLESE